MKKAAIFIHGWVLDDRIFHRKWIRELGAPLFELFSGEFDHHIVPIDLPGNYVHMDRDFDFYADHVLRWITDHPEFGEISLIGHSMGGITVRRLIQKVYGPEEERVKRRIRRAVLLGAPNHGTGQPLANTLSRVLTTIGQKLLPKHLSELTGAKYSILEETPCYRDLDLDGRFMRELNDIREWPSYLKIDNIWTLTDTVVEPTHSALLPGVHNHLVESLSLNHFNMPYRKEIVDKVRSIMKGSARPSGPQGFPPEGICDKGGPHRWWPQYVLPIMETMTHWECRSCGKVVMTHLLPEPFGCSRSRIRDGPHSWKRIRRSYSFKYRCGKCQTSIWYPDLEDI
ncbi:MAG: esterase/lipase family protein [Thermoplasmatota archaeon]